MLWLLAGVACAGTWMPLVNVAPDTIHVMLLLTDGTIIGKGDADSGRSWYKLTPDSRGSYVNGSWSRIASMHYDRFYFSSDVLRDGRVFVAGGEYGEVDDSQTYTAEVYDPISDTWTEVDPPAAVRLVVRDPNRLLFAPSSAEETS